MTDLTIDAEPDEVSHYGVAKTVDIKAVKMGTYSEYGCVARLKLEKGKVEIKPASIVGELDVSAAPSNLSEAAVVNNGMVFKFEKGTNNTIDVTTKSPSEEIEISSADALINIAAAQNQTILVSPLRLKLTADIDLSGRTWTPFGDAFNANKNEPDEYQSPEYAFSGTIDGGNHSITGLSSDGYVGGKSFSIVASQATGTPFSLISYAAGGDVTIKNLTIEAHVTGAWTGVSPFIGAYDQIFDTNEPHTIRFENCVAKGSIEAQEKLGGFLGTSYISGNGKCPRVVFENCTNKAYIHGTKENKARIGGFMGTVNASIEMTLEPISFKNCVNEGAVEGLTEKTKGQFVGATGSGTEQKISFENCSAKSKAFVGVINMDGKLKIGGVEKLVEKTINPDSFTNVTFEINYNAETVYAEQQ